jgi:hypothetical protein
MNCDSEREKATMTDLCLRSCRAPQFAGKLARAGSVSGQTGAAPRRMPRLSKSGLCAPTSHNPVAHGLEQAACATGPLYMSAKEVHVDCAPTILFIVKGEYGVRPEQLAYIRTGRDRETGQWRVAIGIRNRGNRMRFHCDLWRLDVEFVPATLALLETRWQTEHRMLPDKVKARMHRSFSRSHFCFDATAEQTDHWCEFLHELLNDEASYTPIEGLPTRCLEPAR